jgi:hypothetical protein
MRKAIFILFGGLAVGCLAVCLAYWAHTSSLRQIQGRKSSELIWLKQEFRVTEEAFIKISQLHENYLPACHARRKAIAEMSNAIRKKVESEPTVTPEIEEMIKTRGVMFAECQLETLKYCQSVSQLMASNQTKRYLAWVMEKTCLGEPMLDLSDINRWSAV